MAVPQVTSGSKFEFLQYQLRGRVLQADSEPNVRWRDIILNFFYGPATPCDAQPNSPGQKKSLFSATAAEVLAAGQGPVVVPNLGSVQPAGFQATVVTPLISLLNKRWTNNGCFGRWFDDPTDPFISVGAFGTSGVSPVGAGAGATITTLTVDGNGAILTFTAAPVAPGTNYHVGDQLLLGGAGTGAIFQVLTTTTPTSGIIATVGLVSGGSGYAPAVAAVTTSFSYSFPVGDGGVGAIGDSLPLDNNVTVRRYTELRGKNWRGNIRPTPIDETHSDDDQLNAVGQAAWKNFVSPALPVALGANGMYAPISDGESILYPLLISATESQLIRTPTKIAYAPLVLPGIDPVTGNLNAVIDLALGESKRRKERKSVTF